MAWMNTAAGNDAMPHRSPIIRMHPVDDVAVARRPLAPGEELEGGIVVQAPIAFGHKVALRPLAHGEAIRRYGQVIGFANRAIRAGEHVHVDNVEMGTLQHDYAFAADAKTPQPIVEGDTFLGFRRADGRVGTRNYIGILSSVNCSATVVRAISDHFRAGDLAARFPHVDGVVSLPHSLGCAVDGGGDAIALIRRTLAGYARHPNFAGVLLVGLGCETNQIPALMRAEALEGGKLLQTLTIQEAGGTRRAIERGIACIEQMLPVADGCRRVAVPVSHLTVALECGGSDSCSGISANPVLGAAVDRLVARGGTAVLSETPEIYGAEHLLTRRAASRAVGEKLIERIRWWEDYCIRNGAEMNNNPSAGNKAGGLTTILEKSLGAVVKAGSSTLNAVYQYAEPVEASGLVFMDTPGYDPYAVTGQVAGGCNLLVFTTGRGSAFGSVPVPTIKLASNTALWLRQEDDMDLNCGGVVDGTHTIEALGETLYRQMLEVASGAKTKSEQFGYGGLEFAPWQLGAVM
jgi:altronate hydrolase